MSEPATPFRPSPSNHPASSAYNKLQKTYTDLLHAHAKTLEELREAQDQTWRDMLGPGAMCFVAGGVTAVVLLRVAGL